MYWSNWNSSRAGILRARTAGGAPEPVIARDVLMPNGLALEHATRWLYWADARLDKIERARYDGSGREVTSPPSLSSTSCTTVIFK